MINIGASPETIAASISAITRILDYGLHDPSVLVQALKVLGKSCTVKNITISNANLTRNK